MNGDDSIFFFKTGKGLRQGDSLSLILFNLVGDAFTKMLVKAANANLISGLLLDFVKGGVISLQYGDNTILFSELDYHKLSTLSLSLCEREQISRMRINFHKSELIPISLEVE